MGCSTSASVIPGSFSLGRQSSGPLADAPASLDVINHPFNSVYNGTYKWLNGDVWNGKAVYVQQITKELSCYLFFCNKNEAGLRGWSFAMRDPTNCTAKKRWSDGGIISVDHGPAHPPLTVCTVTDSSSVWADCGKVTIKA